MTLRSKLWWAAGAVYAFINVAGAGYAAANNEPVHVAVHVALLIPLAAYLIWRRGSAARQQLLLDARPADARLEQLQHSVDAIALEVERIGEAQRYNAKLQAERTKTRPPDQP